MTFRPPSAYAVPFDASVVIAPPAARIVLIKIGILDGIAAGEVALAFRCWKRPTVRAGGTLRTAVGVIAIDSIDPIDPARITTAEAELAGYRDLDDLFDDLNLREGRLVYRIALRLAGPDPRISLRENAKLTPDDVRSIRQKLQRMDKVGHQGSWTDRFLRLIASNPGLRATELAKIAGSDPVKLKRDIRKLKELGLTESLQPGYRLSPRGKALMKSR